MFYRKHIKESDLVSFNFKYIQCRPWVYKIPELVSVNIKDVHRWPILLNTERTQFVTILPQDNEPFIIHIVNAMLRWPGFFSRQGISDSGNYQIPKEWWCFGPERLRQYIERLKTDTFFHKHRLFLIFRLSPLEPQRHLAISTLTYLTQPRARCHLSRYYVPHLTLHDLPTAFADLTLQFLVCDSKHTDKAGLLQMLKTVLLLT